MSILDRHNPLPTAISPAPTSEWDSGEPSGIQCGRPATSRLPGASEKWTERRGRDWSRQASGQTCGVIRKEGTEVGGHHWKVAAWLVSSRQWVVVAVAA